MRMRAFIYRSGIKFLLLFFLSVAVYGQERLSSRAQMSLLTCEPGDALYEAFGHSALRVYDPFSNIDLVYNYGRFDFNQPNFYQGIPAVYAGYYRFATLFIWVYLL